MDANNESSMKICSNCRQTRLYTDSFCWLCGSTLTQALTNTKCPACGHSLSSSCDRYCSRCGALTELGQQLRSTRVR